MTVAIIGFGNMGKAIAAALAKSFDVAVFDRHANRQAAAKKIGVSWLTTLSDASRYNFIIIAVKPIDVPKLAGQIVLPESVILISIAAGVNIKTLQRLFKHKKCVRVMTNLGLTAGHGIAAWKQAGLSRSDLLKTQKLLNAISENFEADSEDAIDKVTAISGSGPAYFFYLAQAMERSAMALGFPPLVARKLVEETFLGAAELQKGVGYEQLITRIASKKGTTEAALEVFKKNGMEKIVTKAIRAAYLRARELGA